MKPYPFTYHRVRRVEDAVELLAEHGEEIKVLAGGLSLVPMMNLRLAAPPRVLDVNRVDGLDEIRSEGSGALHVGALVRHQALIDRCAGEAAGHPLLPLAGRWIGHAPIRARGTVGGSLAHADPAAEWCLCAVLLEARMHVVSSRGERTIGADDWFRGYFDAALEPDEMLRGVTFARPRGGAGLVEYAQRSGDFAIAIAGAVLDLDQGGVVRDPRVVLGGVAGVPLRLPEVEAALDGSTATDEVIVHAGSLAGRAVTGKPGASGDARYHERLVAALTSRAIAQAVGMDSDRGRRLGRLAVLELESEVAA